MSSSSHGMARTARARLQLQDARTLAYPQAKDRSRCKGIPQKASRYGDECKAVAQSLDHSHSIHKLDGTPPNRQLRVVAVPNLLRLEEGMSQMHRHNCAMDSVPGDRVPKLGT